MRTYYETRTSWRELIRVMGRTEHVNNLLSLVHVFQEIQQVSVLIHEGRSLDELDKNKKSRSIGALPDSRGSAAPLITEVSWEGAQLDSSVTVRYGPSVLQMIEKAHLVSINADVQFRLKGDHAKTFWPFIDSQRPLPGSTRSASRSSPAGSSGPTRRPAQPAPSSARTAGRPSTTWLPPAA